MITSYPYRELLTGLQLGFLIWGLATGGKSYPSLSMFVNRSNVPKRRVSPDVVCSNFQMKIEPVTT